MRRASAMPERACLVSVCSRRGGAPRLAFVALAGDELFERGVHVAVRLAQVRPHRDRRHRFVHGLGAELPPLLDQLVLAGRVVDVVDVLGGDVLARRLEAKPLHLGVGDLRLDALEVAFCERLGWLGVRRCLEQSRHGTERLVAKPERVEDGLAGLIVIVRSLVVLVAFLALLVLVSCVCLSTLSALVVRVVVAVQLELAHDRLLLVVQLSLDLRHALVVVVEHVFALLAERSSHACWLLLH